MIYQVFQNLSCLSVDHPEWSMQGLMLLPDSKSEYCAEFWLGKTTKVWVSLLDHIPTTDVVRQGLVAHQTMHDRTMPAPNVLGVNIVIINGLILRRPVLLSSLVIITNLSIDVLEQGILRIAEQALQHSVTFDH